MVLNQRRSSPRKSRGGGFFTSGAGGRGRVRRPARRANEQRVGLPLPSSLVVCSHVLQWRPYSRSSSLVLSSVFPYFLACFSFPGSRISCVSAS